MSNETDSKFSPSVETVMKELRRRSFGILGTVSRDGRPHATGVAYVASAIGKPLAMYVVTDTGTKKVRNITHNPNVSFVIPIPRTLMTMVPMSCIQFQGKARILAAGDTGAVESLKSTRIGRMMLGTATEANKEDTGGKPVCFIVITPDSVIHTYGIGMSLLQMRRSMGQARGKVEVPAEMRVAG